MAGIFIVHYNCNLFAAEISLAANLISNHTIIGVIFFSSSNQNDDHRHICNSVDHCNYNHHHNMFVLLLMSTPD